jgi:hypothetical protein
VVGIFPNGNVSRDSHTGTCEMAGRDQKGELYSQPRVPDLGEERSGRNLKKYNTLTKGVLFLPKARASNRVGGNK